MELTPQDLELLDKIEAEYQEYLATRTPEQERADNERHAAGLKRLQQMLAMRRLLNEIFKD